MIRSGWNSLRLGHHRQRLGERAGDDPGAVEDHLGVQRLGPGVVDDQHPVRLVEAQAAEGLDLFQHAGGVQGSGEKLLAAGAGRGQAGGGVGLAVAEEQHRQLVFETGLGFAGQLQAHGGAGEVDFHDDRRRVALAHAAAEAVGGLAGQCLQAEELQLLGQASGALAILQGQVDRLAQRRQDGVLGFGRHVAGRCATDAASIG